MVRVLALSVALFAIGCTKAAVREEAPTTAQPAPAQTHTNVQPLADSADGAVKAFDHKPEPGEKALCAVSDEPFTITAETKTAEYEGKWYAFCCDECAPAFAADPAQYAVQ